MQDRTRDAARRGWNRAVLFLVLLLAASITGMPRASAKDQASLRGWQTLDREKNGTVQIRFDIPDPLSHIWTWQFRSTFDHPIHVDYRIDKTSRSGFPMRVERTAFIAAKGSTQRLGFPSYLQPSISIEQVR